MLFDNPPHRVSIYSTSTSQDAGGGVTLNYSATPAQAAVPCLLNTASARTVDWYSQSGNLVSHTVAFASSALAVALTNDMKFTDDDTGKTYKIVGIRAGRAMGTVPALTYADVQQLS